MTPAELDAIRQQVEARRKLVADPHPGLITWSDAVRGVEDRIADGALALLDEVDRLANEYTALTGEHGVAQAEAARYRIEVEASQLQVRDLADLLDAARTERDGALLEAAEWRDQYERMDSEIHTLRTRLGEVIQERDAVRTGCDAQMAQIVEFYGNMAAAEADHQDAQTARIVELSLEHAAIEVERDRLNADLAEANEQRDLLRRRVEAVTRERDEAQAARDYARRDVALWEDEVDQRDATVRKLRRSRRKLHGRYEKILVEDRSVVTSLRAGMAVLKGRVKDADESVRTLAYEAQAEADVQSQRIAKLRRSRARWRRRAGQLNDARPVLDLVVELARRSEIPPHAPRTPLFEALLAAVRDYVAKYPVYLGVGPDAVVTKWTPTGQAFVLEAAVGWYRVMPAELDSHYYGEQELALHAAVAEWLQPPAAPAEPAAGTPTGPDVDPAATERISASLDVNSAAFTDWLTAGTLVDDKMLGVEYSGSGTPLDTDHVPVDADPTAGPILSVTWHPDGSATDDMRATAALLRANATRETLTVDLSRAAPVDGSEFTRQIRQLAGDLGWKIVEESDDAIDDRHMREAAARIRTQPVSDDLQPGLAYAADYLDPDVTAEEFGQRWWPTSYAKPDAPEEAAERHSEEDGSTTKLAIVDELLARTAASALKTLDNAIDVEGRLNALHARSCPSCRSIGDPRDGCRDPWHPGNTHCSQCGRGWAESACGPTHAMIAAERGNDPAAGTGDPGAAATEAVGPLRDAWGNQYMPPLQPGTALQRDTFDADTGKWLATVGAPPSAWRPYVITSDPTWSSNALAKLAELASPYPVIADRNDADTYLAGLLNPEAPIPIPIDRVDPDGAADDDWIGGEPGDEWVHRDDNVLTTLTAAPYPYGGGHPDHGVQITVERDHPTEYEPDRPIQCLRLPHPKAVELANWILAQYDDDDAATTDAPA